MAIHWEKTAGKKGDFSSLAGAGIADMADAAAAAHDGAVGLEITFDDADAAYGILSLPSVDQKSIMARMWFNRNDAALDAGKLLDICYFRNGDGGVNGQIRVVNTAGTYTLQVYAVNDAAAYIGIAGIALPATWTDIRTYIQAASSAAANNGVLEVYINEVLVASTTNIDNDTKDFDDIIVGKGYTDSVGFGGSYYLDTIGIVGKIPSDYAIAPARDLALSAQQRSASLTAHQRDTNMVVLE